MGVSMIQRRVKALDYPNDLKPAEDSSVKEFVLWLESSEFRLSNGEVDKIKGSWPTSFQSYLKELNYPVENGSERGDQVIWLLSKAIEKRYESHRHRLPRIKDLANGLTTFTEESAIDHFDFQSEELKTAVNALANKLRISSHEDHLITLEACCKYLCNTIKDKSSKVEEANVLQDIQDHQMGLVKIKDPVVVNSAKVLRLLHIAGLRDHQNEINKIIVNIQNITANPKTDTALGRVGR